MDLLYVRSLPDLTLDSETPSIPARWHYTIVRGAAYIALQAENEEERAQTAQAQFEADLNKMRARYGRDQIGEPEVIEDSEHLTEIY
jgi:hypothetical protein